jgi:hypothetical protein
MVAVIVPGAVVMVVVVAVVMAVAAVVVGLWLWHKWL